jgi:hypothetical protein
MTTTTRWIASASVTSRHQGMLPLHLVRRLQAQRALSLPQAIQSRPRPRLRWLNVIQIPAGRLDVLRVAWVKGRQTKPSAVACKLSGVSRLRQLHRSATRSSSTTRSPRAWQATSMTTRQMLWICDSRADAVRMHATAVVYSGAGVWAVASLKVFLRARLATQASRPALSWKGDYRPQARRSAS